jgi:hypothetical protein
MEGKCGRGCCCYPLRSQAAPRPCPCAELRADRQADRGLEKVDNDQRLLAGIQSVAPALAALNLVAGTYGRNVAIATGEWAGRHRPQACRAETSQEEMLRPCASPWLPSCVRSARCSRRLQPSPRRAAQRLKARDLQRYVSVAGATGDGEQALSAALAKRLSGMGVKQATASPA